MRRWIISRKVESRQHWFYQIVVLNIETMLDPFTFLYTIDIRARYVHRRNQKLMITTCSLIYFGLLKSASAPQKER